MRRELQNISVIIPCLNEEKCIKKLHREVSGVLGQHACSYELLFVDDGSIDKTLEVLSEIAATDQHVRWISLSRNFGHQKALKAGIDHATGQVVITMDADMQHPPVLIPKMLEMWQEGYDVVNTVRTDDNRCGLFKRITSHCFYRLMNFLSDIKVPESGADFRLLDSKVVRVLQNCHEDALFFRGMIAWVGFRQTQIAYQANVRYAGETKYSIKKMLAFAFCGITSFCISPLRWGIVLSAFFVLLSILEIAYVIYVVSFTGQTVSGWASLAILISILGAVMLLMLGIIGEYLGKLFMQCKQRPEYIIKEQNI